MRSEYNLREAFKRVATFQKVEHLPHFEAMGFWEETIARWHKEGLPLDKSPWEFFQIAQFMDNAPEAIDYHTDNVTRPPYWPPFEIETIEETDTYIVRRESDGIIKKQLKHSTSMPQFLKFPLDEESDWERVKERLEPYIEERYKKAREIAPSLKERDYILRFGICGAYGFQRNLFGVEKLSYMYYDNPKLIHKIMEHWVYLYTGIADNICPIIDFDYVFIWEDMAYKTAPLISPKHFKEFILPYYKELINYLKRRYKLELFMVDSDGNNFSLIPLFIEAGINIFIPCEVNAGMDPLLVRERFPNLCLLGGINKQALIKGKKEIEEEVLKKVPRMLEMGGYFPAVDHHVPSDVSFENFSYYIELMREIE